MELNEFLKKFLSDYEAKYKIGMEQAPYDYDDEQKELWAFYDIFPEALQNFANKICEKQRCICATETIRAIESWVIQGEIELLPSVLLDIENDVKKSKQPKIDEL